jgi:glycosyltransferase involved in cell wall biosynthesis
MGRIRPNKGHAELVEAFLALAEDFPEWRLVLCGSIRPQHQRFAKQLLAQGGGRIHHQPYTSDRAKIYAGVSIVVMASHAEGFSLVVPEAMAHGRVLLASRLPHFESLFKEEVHALAFEAGNSTDLQRQLKRLMEDAALRTQLEAAARRRAVESLGIEMEAKALSGLYERILNGD